MIQMLILSTLLGFAGVLQGGLNKQLLSKWGLFEVSFLNSISVLVWSFMAYFILHYFNPQLPESLKHRGGISEINLLVVAAGFLGFFIVNGVPYAFSRYGALKVFVVLIFAQILGSILWDIFIEKIPLSPVRIISSLLAASSVVVMTMDKQS